MIKLIFFLILLFRCHLINNSENDLKVFNLGSSKKIEKLRLSDLDMKNIHYIPLETNEKSVISSGDNLYFHDYTINKIISAGNSIFFKNHAKIIKFKRTGEFETVIAPIGRGPEEVTQINDFDIDFNTNNIYILSGWQKKIKIYNENGAYLREINLPFYSHELDVYENKIILSCGNNSGKNEYSYIILDLNGNVLRYFRNNHKFTNKSGYGFAHENLFYQTGDKLCRKGIYSDTIYYLNKNSYIPYLVLEAGNRLITPEVMTSKDMIYICNNYIQPMSLFEFGNFIYYQYMYKYNPPSEAIFYGFIGSKTDNYSVVFDAESGIINDLDGGPDFQPLFVNGENELVSLKDPLSLKSYIKSASFKNSVPKYPEKKKEFEKLVNSLKETDNPVLILVK
ncbi:MAG TPA: 6-bladed beta-propeller [Bacteroidales bacterium]|nr:6-bladed beta-propeller [Bacteroidales bacterium]HQK67352.1 6-bladed beta-propeller [Bacteroidales bacterium]